MKIIKYYEQYHTKHNFKELENILLNEDGNKVIETLEEDLDRLIEDGDFYYTDDYVYEVCPMHVHSNCRSTISENKPFSAISSS